MNQINEEEEIDVSPRINPQHTGFAEIPNTLVEGLDFTEVWIPGAKDSINRKKSITVYYACYGWYEYDGRLLVLEEIRAIMRSKFFGDEWVINKSMLKRFNNKDDQLTIVLDGLDKEKQDDLCDLIDRWFRELLDTNFEARIRAECLVGFPSPFLYIATEDAALYTDESFLEDYQYLLHYGLVKYYRDCNGNAITEDKYVAILAHHYEKFSSKFREYLVYHFITLGNPDNKITTIVAPVAEDYEFLVKEMIKRVVDKYEANLS